MRTPANARRRSRARPVLCFTAILCAREMRDVRVASVGRGVRVSTVARTRAKNCIAESKAGLHCREEEDERGDLRPINSNPGSARGQYREDQPKGVLRKKKDRWRSEERQRSAGKNKRKRNWRLGPPERDLRIYSLRRENTLQGRALATHDETVRTPRQSTAVFFLVSIPLHSFQLAWLEPMVAERKNNYGPLSQQQVNTKTMAALPKTTNDTNRPSKTPP